MSLWMQDLASLPDPVKLPVNFFGKKDPTLPTSWIMSRNDGMSHKCPIRTASCEAFLRHGICLWCKKLWLCFNIFMYAYKLCHTYTHIHVCMYVCMYVCIYIFAVHIYIYKNICQLYISIDMHLLRYASCSSYAHLWCRPCLWGTCWRWRTWASATHRNSHWWGRHRNGYPKPKKWCPRMVQ